MVQLLLCIHKYMQQIIFHHLSVPYAQAHSDQVFFEHNGMFYAEAGDMVILRGGLPSEAEWFSVLHEAGFIAPDINVFHMPPSFTQADIEKDQIVRDAISQFLQNRECSYDVFMESAFEHRLSALWDIKLLSLQGQYEKYYTKSSFRESAQLIDLPIADGFSSLVGQTSIEEAARQLFVKGNTELVIKHDAGTAGLSMARITEPDVSNVQNLMPSVDVQSDTDDTYIVEAWHTDILYRPSLQVYIDPVSGPQLISVHDQHMLSNQMTYAGCASQDWIPAHIVEEIHATTRPHLKMLHEQGFVGHLSYNAIVNDKDEVLYTEINPRKVISSYAARIAKRLGTDKPYRLVRIENSNWQGLAPMDVVHKLGSLRYTSGTGALPIDCKYLGAFGIAMLLVFGSDKKEVDDICEALRT